MGQESLPSPKRLFGGNAVLVNQDVVCINFIIHQRAMYILIVLCIVIRENNLNKKQDNWVIQLKDKI